MTPRRSKGKVLSEEEQALFQAALADVKPLVKRSRISPVPETQAGFAPPPRPLRMPTPGDVPAPAIAGHAEDHLRRGRREPEARLDLHGLTQDGAYRRLARFLIAAQRDGKKLVLVITGKGGVLRERLPFWLGQEDLKPMVVGTGQAHIRHGGGGAFYITLRARAARR